MRERRASVPPEIQLANECDKCSTGPLHLQAQFQRSDMNFDPSTVSRTLFATDGSGSPFRFVAPFQCLRSENRHCGDASRDINNKPCKFLFDGGMV